MKANVNAFNAVLFSFSGLVRILVEDHPGIIPVEFGQILISSLGEEVVLSFPNIIHCKVVTLRGKVKFDLCII